MLGHWNTQRNSPILRPSRAAADTALSSNAASLKDHAATRCDCLVGQCMPFPINSSISPNCQAGIASPKSAIKSPESAAKAHCPQSPTPIRRTGPIGAQVTPAAEWQRSGHRSPWQSGPVGHRGGPRRQPRGHRSRPGRAACKERISGPSKVWRARSAGDRTARTGWMASDA